MKALDRRHRWEVTERKNATITHTCRVCQRAVTFEMLVPDAVIEAIIRRATQANPYRALMGLAT